MLIEAAHRGTLAVAQSADMRYVSGINLIIQAFCTLCMCWSAALGGSNVIPCCSGVHREILSDPVMQGHQSDLLPGRDEFPEVHSMAWSKLISRQAATHC